jgi:hypothetical protein
MAAMGRYQLSEPRGFDFRNTTDEIVLRQALKWQYTLAHRLHAQTKEQLKNLKGNSPEDMTSERYQENLVAKGAVCHCQPHQCRFNLSRTSTQAGWKIAPIKAPSVVGKSEKWISNPELMHPPDAIQCSPSSSFEEYLTKKLQEGQKEVLLDRGRPNYRKYRQYDECSGCGQINRPMKSGKNKWTIETEASAGGGVPRWCFIEEPAFRSEK